jgi:hypothetical protein
MIIIEPMVNPAGGDKLAPLRKRLITSARTRRDAWPSRAEALMVLKKRKGTKKWDEGVLRLFVVSLFPLMVLLRRPRAVTDEDVFLGTRNEGEGRWAGWVGVYERTGSGMYPRLFSSSSHLTPFFITDDVQ